jgi:hypothetical protein
MSCLRIAALYITTAMLSLSCNAGQAQEALRDGDLIFQTSRSSQSQAVQRATHSPLSHMGLIVHRKGKPFVLEAAATVRYTPLAAWIARGVGSHYTVKRLRDAAERLTPAALAEAQRAIAPLLGKPYDLTFEWSDQRMYCSELVWKIYDRALGVHLGELSQLRDFALDDPLVKQKLEERYGLNPPLDEPVISPAAMFEAPQLETVATR